MTTKNGVINDGRQMFLNGKLMEDFTDYPVLANTLKIIQNYYLLQEQKDEHSFLDNGKRYSTTFLTPKSVKDLKLKHKIYREIAENSYGLIGRGNEFLNSGIAVLPYYSDFFGANEWTNFSENLKNYAAEMKAKDLFISHALQNPQVNRALTLHENLAAGEVFSGTWVKEKNSSGIIIQGAKMVNTLAPFADELLVYNVPGLQLGDERFANAFSVPLNTKGVKIWLRKPTAKSDYTVADYPLSNLMDESDAFITFEDVFIPWERVFVEGDVEKSDQFFPKSGLFVHTAHQDEVRGLVKLEFVTALTVKVATALGLTSFLRTQEVLGKLTRNLELIRGTINWAEDSGQMENDVFTPNMQALLAVRDILPEMYREVIITLQEFSGGSIVAIPDVETFNAYPELLESVLNSKLISAKERIVLLNLAWEIAGESFGSRQQTYETLHGGNPMWIKIMHWQHEDLRLGNQMLDKALSDGLKGFSK
ncbi:MAG: 4-hydroxyphenylacetate 3-hydroxylase [Streptococcaceae bacterium]|jgi:4-hydroxyphenylacetate 3-monooxygenase|nr:4-hydroxyphenylacetate 3-hydroxylase [Streptococcaceae bacterium]